VEILIFLRIAEFLATSGQPGRDHPAPYFFVPRRNNDASLSSRNKTSLAPSANFLGEKGGKKDPEQNPQQKYPSQYGQDYFFVTHLH